MDVPRLLHVSTVRSDNLRDVADNLYSDPGPRTLSGSGYTDAAAMTDESCISYCSGLGYIYAGTEYANECCKFELAIYSNKCATYMMSDRLWKHHCYHGCRGSFNRL